MKGITVAGFIIFTIWLAAIVGWINNIVVIFHTASDPITGVFILRIAGIFLAPLGAILGYL
ncbi:MAG TPA: hypothetical protein VFM18_17690 [Methanosarcina sp.]|nr:hypothetical protein [Methanosarcina sp.]